MISIHFQGKLFNITTIQVYAPISNAKEAEIERFHDDIQDLLELTLKKKMSFSSWGVGMQKQKLKRYLEEQATLALEYKMKQGKGKHSFSKRMHWSYQTHSSNNTRENSTHGYQQMVNTEISLIIFFATKDGEVLYSEKKQDQELTGSDHELLVAKFRLNRRKQGKPLDHSGMT